MTSDMVVQPGGAMGKFSPQSPNAHGAVAMKLQKRDGGFPVGQKNAMEEGAGNSFPSPFEVANSKKSKVSSLTLSLVLTNSTKLCREGRKLGKASRNA